MEPETLAYDINDEALQTWQVPPAAAPEPPAAPVAAHATSPSRLPPVPLWSASSATAAGGQVCTSSIEPTLRLEDPAPPANGAADAAYPETQAYEAEDAGMMAPTIAYDAAGGGLGGGAAEADGEVPPTLAYDTCAVTAAEEAAAAAAPAMHANAPGAGRRGFSPLRQAPLETQAYETQALVCAATQDYGTQVVGAAAPEAGVKLECGDRSILEAGMLPGNIFETQCEAVLETQNYADVGNVTSAPPTSAPLASSRPSGAAAAKENAVEFLTQAAPDTLVDLSAGAEPLQIASGGSS
eukprot:TRINITY_DN2832_c0_g2_i1.p1 TRINITY_DN2832_c0_g2~~TRINITY_DN2832_c0_g2_i1.p1  ORF type:complete len:297 (+),score=74.92 TRINITY_DN2832_c0_g2_i1:64-954(+)